MKQKMRVFLWMIGLVSFLAMGSSYVVMAQEEAAEGTDAAAEAVAEIAYPAILKGRRVIVPGGMNKLAVLVGKVLPFPWSIRVMTFVYSLGISRTCGTSTRAGSSRCRARRGRTALLASRSFG